jgi:hypothetical protein
MEVSVILYTRPGNWLIDVISSGALTLKDPSTAFPVTVQLTVPGEKKFGLLAVRVQVVATVKVLFIFAVKVTQVPGGPRLGSKVRLDDKETFKAAARAGGTAIEETETKTVEMSNSST